MDITTKRCGCGTVYRPMVRTQSACEACGERHRAAARAELGPVPKYEVPVDKWRERTLVAGTGITIRDDSPTVIGVFDTNDHVATLAPGNPLDRVGAIYGMTRQCVERAITAPSGVTVKYKSRETDLEYQARLYKHMTTPVTLKLTVQAPVEY